MPVSFAATLYAPTVPSTGILVNCYFVGQLLKIETMPVEVHCASLVVSVGGFEHNELFLNWQELGQAWAIKAQSSKDIQVILATAPTNLANQLQKWHHKDRHIKTVWSLIGGAVAVCVLAIVGLWWQYDNILTWAASKVPLSTEEKLGQAALEQFKAEHTILNEGKAATTVADIGKRLTQGSRYRYQWYIKHDNTINAFALPGGVIVVHSALINKASNADELAAVLAHEVQHVERQHALKNMIHSAGWATVLAVVLGDVSAVTAVIAHQLGTSYFSRDLEAEADRLGYATLVKANIKPDGMVSFFQKLQAAHGDSGGLAWISSHPETEARIDAMKKLLKEQPCVPCKPLSVDWPAVQQALKGVKPPQPAVKQQTEATQ
ncbi:M48 family metallopeptidase [Agitococcus lubricus]|uniref:Peptidase M48-like protein n=1 Tax=Agitococcus lubricus TaxID=1077255 RepID=A0A2T5J2Y7_9GAMM|nr:M48 family metallopeptidase [Agitococcus lubricus]PTQ90965.1 peptidase M48-like protein [Agitococcus lubricus]